MRVLYFLILIQMCGIASANETYLVKAEQVDYFDFPDDVCSPDEICIRCGWFRYKIDGWSTDTGEVISHTIAGLSHTWYRTDAPWLVTLKPTKGEAEYEFLNVEYVIEEINVFDHFVCLDESQQIAGATEDIVYDDEWSDDEIPRKCYSYYSIQDVIPDEMEEKD